MAHGFNFDFPPPEGVPISIGWQRVKQLLVPRYASAFSVQQVWRQLASLKFGRDINEYNQRYMELLYLAGKAQPPSVRDHKPSRFARGTWMPWSATRGARSW